MKKTTTARTNRSLTRTSRIFIATAYHSDRREEQQYSLRILLTSALRCKLARFAFCFYAHMGSVRMLRDAQSLSSFSQNHLSATICLRPISYKQGGQVWMIVRVLRKVEDL